MLILKSAKFGVISDQVSTRDSLTVEPRIFGAHQSQMGAVKLGRPVFQPTTPDREKSDRHRDSTQFQINQEIEGIVTGVAQYGIFVTFPNGESGLVFSSELCRPGDRAHFKINQMVTVKVIGFTPGKGLALSIIRVDKSKLFEQFTSEHEVGDVLVGKVRQIIIHGVCIALANGVDGLIHRRDFDDESEINNIEINDSMMVRIAQIVPETSQILLSAKV